MSTIPRTVEQAMELAIQHHVGPEMDGPVLDAVSPLEAHLARLPEAVSAVLREELAKGTLVLTLAPGGVRIRSVEPKGRRAGRAGRNRPVLATPSGQPDTGTHD